MWDLLGPGLEPLSPALAGGFLTTVPPGKSLIIFYLEDFSHFKSQNTKFKKFWKTEKQTKSPQVLMITLLRSRNILEFSKNTKMSSYCHNVLLSF